MGAPGYRIRKINDKEKPTKFLTDLPRVTCESIYLL